MAKVTPSIAGLASILAKAPDMTVDKFFTVVIISLVVPINAPKVDINLPTINIAGPNAATSKPALTINPCVSGLRDLKPSTNLCSPALSVATTASKFNVSLIDLPNSANDALTLSFKLSKVLANPPLALSKFPKAPTDLFINSSLLIPSSLIPSAVTTPNSSFITRANSGSLSFI